MYFYTTLYLLHIPETKTVLYQREMKLTLQSANTYSLSLYLYIYNTYITLYCIISIHLNVFNTLFYFILFHSVTHLHIYMCVYIYIHIELSLYLYGGFLSHRGTPSHHHPFLGGISHYKPSISGYPHGHGPPRRPVSPRRGAAAAASPWPRPRGSSAPLRRGPRRHPRRNQGGWCLGKTGDLRNQRW